MELMDKIQQHSDHDGQSTVQKLATVAAGFGGISLKFSDVATIAQQIGMIVGCILVCGQAFVFFRGLWKARRRAASNDQ